ncbi:DUF2490 domain-containing protein [Aureisphaera galaxeae]|uniref:DUF2490 domain-containing protein n=1 Tax=Aureisphaera galaxeae TaxID=1538023 RepID=UPI00235090B8|nr:DUF2490 domain-containing protein [Aureisphaera galaxeae]MDC8002843.1 DUF2490 domain-containing protein [Aureisphaera galaxeae]
MHRFYFFVAIIIIPIISFAQENDLTSWTCFQVKHKLNDKYQISIKPTLRSNNDLSEFDNIFFDVSVNRKFGENLSFKILNRLVTDFDNRFGSVFFFDMSYKTKLRQNLTLTGRSRYHLGINKNYFGSDFLRIEPKVKFKASKNYNLSAAADFWYHTNESFRLQRIRYQIGVGFRMTNRTSFQLAYWLEDFKRLRRNSKIHIIVTNLVLDIE